MIHSVDIDLGGAPVALETGRWAKQANGAVFARQGDTALLATACASNEPKQGADFLPLSVDVAEKFYALGRLPGGFFKREGRPSSDAILAARLCDRPHRPLFPEGYHNETQIIITILSADRVHPYAALGIIAASAALAISDVPFNDPVGACVVGMLNGKLSLNPTYEQLKNSDLELTVAGTGEAIMMVEAGAKMVSEEAMLEALKFGQEMNGRIVEKIRELQAKAGKEKWEVALSSEEEEVAIKATRDYVGDSIKQSLHSTADNKKGRQAAIDEVKSTAMEKLSGDYIESAVKEELHRLEKKAVREAILFEGSRPDGRKMDEIRPLESETGVLPRVHGSAVFTRGETQILNVVTLAPVSEAQKLDSFGIDNEKTFIHHYNFPPYSTGEAGRFGATGRREVGHGALAERALVPVIPDQELFPYTIRSVSEALSSNGSTSMASVCSGSLALMDAGVPIKSAVAGIAMGLVTDSEGNYAVMTDIQGAEDHSGDMDFKVAGTREGITALQMDIKVKGITFEIMREALEQALKARLEILDHMDQTIQSPRDTVSKYAPRMHTLKIPVEKIGAVIGTGGSVIRSLIEEYDVTINVDDDGVVTIGSTDEKKAEQAEKAVRMLTSEVEVGQKYRGKVVRTAPFGAFVQLYPGKDALVHISELSVDRVPSVTSVVNVGDELEVIVIEIDGMGKVGASVRALLEQDPNFEGEPRASRQRGPDTDSRSDYRRGGGGGNRGRGDRSYSERRQSNRNFNNPSSRNEGRRKLRDNSDRRQRGNFRSPDR